MNRAIYLLLIVCFFSCKVKSDYQKALTAHNALTYENYLTNYPASNYRIDVKQRLDSIYDQNAWLVACRSESSKGYQ
jgi:outer membrane protein assembly factor BamD (BamD/ComL family)